VKREELKMFKHYYFKIHNSIDSNWSDPFLTSTPFCNACVGGYLEIVKLLLNDGRFDGEIKKKKKKKEDPLKGNGSQMTLPVSRKTKML